MTLTKRLIITGCLLVLCCVIPISGAAQLRNPGINGRSGGHNIFGDVQVGDETVNSSKTVRFDIVLYTESRTIVARDTVASGGRYRFNNIPSGLYSIVIEVEGQEVARVRVDATSPLVQDIRQDLAFELKSNSTATSRATTISPADIYKRNETNAALWAKAGKAADLKHYDEATQLLKKIVDDDPKDFQAWTELGNVHLLDSRYSDSESEYLRAIDLHSNYFPALLNLGRAEIALKKFDMAIDVLGRAVKTRPDSAEANYLLGEAYLQVKKGSLAVGYLNEALRLEPKEMAEAHLRLALLYNAAGMKDKAAAEYEAFLKQRPDFDDRKKLEDYIKAYKKP
jgi:tetratricopeptide (TPR) repeat protein